MDQKRFQKTFDQVHMSAERTAEVREKLAARCAEQNLEVADMMKNKKKGLAALAAACAVLALSVTAFASGGSVLGRVFQMISIPTAQQGIAEDGSSYFEGDAGEPVSPVELREDGRLYLTVNGENLDITEACSYETPYIYTCTGGDGLEHTFIIGGEPENIGWIEYAGDEDSDIAVGEMVISIPDNTAPEELPWLNEGFQQAMGIRLTQLPYQVSDGQAFTYSSSPEEHIENVILYDADGNEVGQSSQVTTVTVTKAPDLP